MSWVFITVTLLVVAFVFITINKTSKLLSDAHLIEVSRELGPLKSNALESMDREQVPSETISIQSGATTSQGLILCYTIDRENTFTYNHRLSFSRADDILTHSSAQILARWCEYSLALPPGSLEAVRDIPAFTGVRHYLSVLNDDEQKAYIQVEVFVPNATDVKPKLKQLLSHH